MELITELTTDLNAISSLLAENNLPYEDIKSTSISFYRIINDTTEVGIFGIEVFGELGLLRSVVVHQNFRGQHIGKMLIQKALQTAYDLNINQLFLLTTNTEKFFNACGFVKMDRQLVPNRIKKSQEFSSLCPDTAILMEKTIS